MVGPTRVQHRQFAGLNHGTRRQFHASLASDHRFIGVANCVVSHDGSISGDEGRPRFIQRDQGLDIAAIEGVKKEDMDFGWSIRGHLIALPDAAGP